MSFDKLVEEKIKEAMANGEFDNLAGKGKPLDLSDYFATPEELRLGYSVLKSAHVIPPEAQLLGELDELRTRLDKSRNAEEQRRLKKAIEEVTLKLNLLVEYYKRKGRRS